MLKGITIQLFMKETSINRRHHQALCLRLHLLHLSSGVAFAGCAPFLQEASILWLQVSV